MLQKCIQKIKRECHGENMFLKADRALSIIEKKLLNPSRKSGCLTSQEKVL